MENEPRIDSLVEAERQIHQLYRTYAGLLARVEEVESKLNTLGSPMWKRVLFRVDGWGPWYRVAGEPKARPWRRWWVS